MDGKRAFVDAYAHFHDPSNPAFDYPSLVSHPLLGEHIRRLQGHRFDVHDYLEAARGVNLVAAVHVEADAGADDPAAETAWVQAAADETGFPQAIVGLTDLTRADAAAVIERHRRHRNLRGVRHRSRGVDFFEHPAFESAYSRLAAAGLSCEFAARPPGTAAKLRDLALRHPGIPVALSHCGMQLAGGGDPREPAFFAEWRGELETLAEAENVWCKISGIPVFDHDWTPESLRPWVMAVIEAFGTGRCMFGTHFPYDMLFGSMKTLVDGYAETISGLCGREQADLFAGNALRFYRIGPAAREM